MKKRLLALLLTLAMLVSVMAVGSVHSVAATAQYAQSSVEGGAILHCFDWSYNNIKANLEDIYKAGYTAVQTSPVQSPKDYSPYWTDYSGQWWKLYQPIDFTVSNNNWLGTKAELKSLCDEADKYGIKVIVDIVANHMGNAGSTYEPLSGINSGVSETLRTNTAYWHMTSTTSGGSSHYDMTQHCNGQLPDLNTSNAYIQSLVANLLKECVDCGVDGFRFDAAQNIEVPGETDSSHGSFGSNFWPTVMNAVKSYATSPLFSYGEMYYDAWGTIDSYLNYIGHVSEPYTGLKTLEAVKSSNASGMASSTYYNNRSANYNIVWVESHDSYNNGTGMSSGNSKSYTNEQIIRAWAITGSRNKATSLFFARPNSVMGAASSDTTWKSAAVAEVNKFKNYFAGQSEYLASSGSVAYNERGTSGVVISKLDGAGNVSLTAHKMASGTYTDQITGNEFSVSGGKITGTVGDTGVAVVYNVSADTSETTSGDASLSKTYYLFGYINGADYACEGDYANMGSYKFAAGSDGTLTATFTADSYVAVKENNNANWYMFQNYVSDGTETKLYNTSTGAQEKMKVPGNKKVTFTLKENSDGTISLSYADYVAPTQAPTQAPTAEPTEKPTQAPVTDAPTSAPTVKPTEAPETVAPTSAPTSASVADGYYIVGTIGGVTSWTPAAENMLDFNIHADGANEYMIEKTFTDGDAIKVVHVSNNTITAWYKDGMNNEYKLTDEGGKTGLCTVYFRPDGKEDWSYTYFTVIKNETPTVPTEEPTEKVVIIPVYYLVGSMSDWKIDEQYKMWDTSPDDYDTYTVFDVPLTAGDEIKAAKTIQGEITAWYPAGTNNNYQVTKTGIYDVTVRPDGRAPSSWYLNILLVKENEPTESPTDAPTSQPTAEPTEFPTTSPEIEDGYYLVGTIGGVTSWTPAAENKLVVNENADGEYMIDKTFADGDALKVAKVENGAVSAWYKDGTDNEYLITAEGSKTGLCTVYFRPEGNEAWSYTYFTVMRKETPTASPTTAPTAEPTTAPTAEPTTEPTVKPTDEPTPTVTDGYYLVGTIGGVTSWDPAAENKLAVNADAEGEYMLVKTFQNNDAIKVVKVENGVKTAWYKDGMDNEYVLTDEGKKTGECTVYFRPAGNEDWSYTYFTVIKNEAPTTAPTVEPTTEPTVKPTDEPTPTVTDGYYLVGTIGGVTSWEPAAENKLAANEHAEGEYMLVKTFKNNDAIKVVKVENGVKTTWYKDGTDNEYVLTDEGKKTGECTVYFRPAGNEDWSYTYFTVIKNETPTAAPGTYMIGDADGDGEITVLDATLIQRLLADLVTDADGSIAKRGKVVDDSLKLSVLDATNIQRYLAGLTLNGCLEIGKTTSK